MKFSEHYLGYRFQIRGITLGQAAWIVENAVRVAVQEDGRTRYWAYLNELQRYVRVVVEPDGETIVTVFMDSSFRP